MYMYVYVYMNIYYTRDKFVHVALLIANALPCCAASKYTYINKYCILFTYYTYVCMYVCIIHIILYIHVYICIYIYIYI